MYNMNDLTILHLSDLHFDTAGACPQKLYNSLLEDIDKQIAFSKNIVLVLTGDIVNKADYKCESLVLGFFTKLKAIFDNHDKVVYRIYSVPGNHDKARTYQSGYLVQSADEYSSDYEKSFWTYHKKSFSNYDKLIGKINKIFGLTNPFPKTYGASQLKIQGNYFNFIGFNTSWSAVGDEDRRNLKIGDFQRTKIEAEYKEISLADGFSENKSVVTFALAHHPLNWLIGKEEDLTRNFLIGQRGIGANIFLCGHTHTRDVINWSNNRHSLTTLSTGIGWPDSENSDHSDLHAYAIYVIHLDINSIDIYVRGTDDGGAFKDDYRIYTSSENLNYKKIFLPINSTSTQSHFLLGTTKTRSPKACFFNEYQISEFQKYVKSIQWVTDYALKTIENGRDCLDSYIASRNNPESKFQIHKYFVGFLQGICDSLAQELLTDWDQNCDSQVRFHFRCCQKQENKFMYKKVCLSFWPRRENYNKELKNLQYGQLIKDSFEAQRPLIYSANPDSCNKDTNAEDFITIIPRCINNILVFKSKHRNIERPIITFGASIYDLKYRPILYSLDFFRFDLSLEMLIERFAEEIPLDLSEFMGNISSILLEGSN